MTGIKREREVAVRFVFTGGGTGGHVYPGLSVVAALQASQPDARILYAGREDGPERRLAAAAGLAFAGFPAAGLRGKSPAAMARGVWSLLRGTARAWRVLGKALPDAVFATGGYASIPVVVAARLRRRPVLVFLPDVHPGWAVRFSARQAARVATTSDAALPHLPKNKSVVTGYPIRPAFAEVTRPPARDHFGLPPKLPVLLVTGGSSGSRDLNRAVAKHLPQFLRLGLHLLHICGAQYEEELRQIAEKLPDELRERYHLFAYIDDMPQAMAASDLAVMRSGASALGELPAVGLPAVLVPGPFSDQVKNAEFLVAQGAAVLLPNEELDRLFGIVQALLTNPLRLAAMRRAMTALAQPHAAERLAELLVELAER